ncbi:MAG: PfkB family carbohydrate kinase [Candidatus Berkelbacteria bacterium]|nr:PfkB family carbohydrate kinase [Candidatus Berkelbacteria bacterium]
MEDKSILVIGDVAKDTVLELSEQEACLTKNLRSKDREICFEYGEKIPVETIRNYFGGGALNVSVGLAKLGLPVKIATFISDGSSSDEIIDFLKINKIDTKSIVKNGFTNQSTILVWEKERTIFSYHEPRDYSKMKLEKTQWIYLASAAKGSESLKNELISFVRSGSRLVFNPGSWELQNFDIFSSLIKHCSIFILNKDEADEIISDKEDIKKQLQKMLILGTKIAIITDGANGAYFAAQDQYSHMNSFAGKVVDPTGAGDSFACAVLGSIILGKSLEESVKWGMVNSASVVGSYGANAGLLKQNEIENYLKDAKSLKLSKI